MNIWMLVDDRGCILALNPTDMTGNSGWIGTTVEALGIDMDTPLCDDHGAALYVLDGDAAAARSVAERQSEWTEDAAGASGDIEARITSAEETLHTHDQEINQIVMGLEALANG